MLCCVYRHAQSSGQYHPCHMTPENNTEIDLAFRHDKELFKIIFSFSVTTFQNTSKLARSKIIE